MTNKEIFNLEYNRDEKTINYIYLIRNNSGFWRANEYSCYLMYNFDNGLEEENRLKLSNKPTKGAEDNTMISCGCKIQSFPKFLPGLKEKESNDNYKIFEVKSLYTLNEYKSVLKAFKDTVPVVESSTEFLTKKSSSPFNEPITFTSIIRKIIRYSVYNKTDEELVEFIDELKNDSASLF